MLLKSEFYWEGYSSSLKNIIDNCLICAKTKNINISDRPEMKHIIPNGPHHRYQSDLWELDKDLVSRIEFRYILDIKVCFSKWM